MAGGLEAVVSPSVDGFVYNSTRRRLTCRLTYGHTNDAGNTLDTKKRFKLHFSTRFK